MTRSRFSGRATPESPGKVSVFRTPSTEEPLDSWRGGASLIRWLVPASRERVYVAPRSGQVQAATHRPVSRKRDRPVVFLGMTPEEWEAGYAERTEPCTTCGHVRAVHYLNENGRPRCATRLSAFGTPKMSICGCGKPPLTWKLTKPNMPPTRPRSSIPERSVPSQGVDREDAGGSPAEGSRSSAEPGPMRPGSFRFE